MASWLLAETSGKFNSNPLVVGSLMENPLKPHWKNIKIIGGKFYDKIF